MAINKLTSTKGNIRGVNNCASFGKDKITSTTASGTITTGSGTKLIHTAVVAGGGSGSQAGAGGGGGGMILQENIKVCSSSPYAIVVGGGGAAETYPDVTTRGANGCASSFAPGTPIAVCTTGGGAGGNNANGPTPACGSGAPGGSRWNSTRTTKSCSTLRWRRWWKICCWITSTCN